MTQDDASSISSFDASSEIGDTRKTTTIIKRDTIQEKRFFDKNIDMGIDIIANTKKLAQIANATDEHIPGTSQNRMDESGKVSPRSEFEYVKKEHSMEDDYKSLNDSDTASDDETSYGDDVRMSQDEIIREKQLIKSH